MRRPAVLLLTLLAATACSAPQPTTPTRPAQPTYNPPATSEATGPKTTFGDGTWVVGEDIAPGRYRSAGAREGMFEYCQITTHSDLDGESAFMAWENGNAGDPVRVNISGKVKSVKATGCEDFEKVG
jgi:hypothetical protein